MLRGQGSREQSCVVENHALPSLARPEWLPAEVWPFETRALQLKRTTVAVTDVGRGPVLLFYTGIGSFVWRDIIVRLSNEFRCIALDPPGIGLSAPIARAETSLAASADAVIEAIDMLDLRDFTLVVHDTGGPPAIAGASRRPERVRGIVGVNTFGWRPSGTAFRGMLALMGSGAMRRIDLTTGLLARVTATGFGVGRRLDASSRRAYRLGIARSLGPFHDYMRDARRSDALYEELDRALRGPFGRVPLLTIFGERNDPLGFQPRWKALFPDARQVVVTRGNHFPMCDDPALVADAIRSWHHDRIAR